MLESLDRSRVTAVHGLEWGLPVEEEREKNTQDALGLAKIMEAKASSGDAANKLLGISRASTPWMTVPLALCTRTVDGNTEEGKKGLYPLTRSELEEATETLTELVRGGKAGEAQLQPRKGDIMGVAGVVTMTSALSLSKTHVQLDAGSNEATP